MHVWTLGHKVVLKLPKLRAIANNSNSALPDTRETRPGRPPDARETRPVRPGILCLQWSHKKLSGGSRPQDPPKQALESRFWLRMANLWGCTPRHPSETTRRRRGGWTRLESNNPKQSCWGKITTPRDTSHWVLKQCHNNLPGDTFHVLNHFPPLARDSVTWHS